VLSRIWSPHSLCWDFLQAVAAMAWGTESCPKVHKILGPGNQYVTAAKMTLQNSEAMVSIDMPAGPSEVLVIADKYASPVHVAADLLSQAEHGPDSQVVLVAVGDEVDTGAIEREIVQQCLDLPRGTIAAKALSHSFVLVVKNMAEVRNTVLYHFISGFAIGNIDRVRAMRACCQAYGV
jgi:histidinol dehydrogenase